MKKKSGDYDLAVVGLSHQGLVVSICLASLKKGVLGLDDDKQHIDLLSRGQLPYFEQGLEKLLKKSQKNIHFSANFQKLKNIPTVFFTQDTATTGSGSTDKLNSLVSQAIGHVPNNVTIIIMSQVPIGFCRKLTKKIKALRPDLNFYLYHWVDTIIMTKAIDRFLNPERIIIGTSSPEPVSLNLKKILQLFSCPIFEMSYESAEVTKAAINLYLANTVTFANTLSDFCEAGGADINEIIPALQTDKRIGPDAYLKPGLGIAGGHIERDLLMFKRLAKNKRISSGIVKNILSASDNRYLWAKKKLSKFKTICLWGLSYKKNSDSTENAASVKIINKLSKKHKFQVYDPLAKMPKGMLGYKRFKDKYLALKGADCLLILTDWDEFQKVDIRKMKEVMKQKIIIDSVGVLYSQRVKLAGFKYITVGVGASSVISNSS